MLRGGAERACEHMPEQDILPMPPTVYSLCYKLFISASAKFTPFEFEKPLV